jgi:thioesterase domain-containing protein
MGGVLAIAVAKVLESQGQRVAFVGLLDAHVFTSRTSSWDDDPILGSVLALGGTMASALATLDPAEQHALRDELLILPPTERLPRLLSWGWQRQLLSTVPPLEILQRFATLAEVHVRMHRAHHITPIQAPLYVWWAREGLQERPDWGPYTSGATYTEFAEGNHFSMLQLPLVQVLAEWLSTRLQTAQRASAAEVSGPLDALSADARA